MQIKRAEFITSVADSKDFLKADKPIIAISGRSNVGKSSFINMLANRKQLARTSSAPGRTRLINYFDFAYFILADLPGYGYAKVSKEEKEKWGQLLDAFFKRTQVEHCLTLVDIRHEPTIQDRQMLDFLYTMQIPFTVVATKADKLAKSKRIVGIREVAKNLKIGIENIIATSVPQEYGKVEILNKIDEICKIYLQKQELYENYTLENMLK